MFIQKQNFWNSVPTDRRSALQLLSAPICRFKQQTVICCVSLWPFVSELQPQKRPCTQVVHRTSAEVTLKEHEELRVYSKFCYKLSKTFTETFQLHSQHTGRTVWVVHSAMSSLSVLNTIQYRLMMILSLNYLPHEQMMTIFERVPDAIR